MPVTSLRHPAPLDSVPGPWIQTYDGRALHVLAPRAEEISLTAVAHALSQKTRYTGHAKWHYSVAQHCVLGADCIVRANRGAYHSSAVKAAAFMLHELGEVYLPDVASPLKPHLWVRATDPLTGATREMSWRALEDVHTKSILEALGLYNYACRLDWTSVHDMDRAMLMAEAPVLLRCLFPGWGYSDAPAPARIQKWSPEVAESAWLEALHYYTRRAAADGWIA